MWEFIVLGCGSACPTPHRGTSGYVLRLSNGDCWLFDCGEATQIELMKSVVHAGRIKCIFITHLHGDHVFGLPGLLCTMGQLGGAPEEGKEEPVVEIFGPRGLRRLVREVMRLSRSVLPYTYRVHELHFDDKVWKTTEPFTGPEAQLEAVNWDPELEMSTNGPPHPNETIDGARDIWPDETKRWTLLSDAAPCSIYATWLPHTAPSFVFLIIEPDKVGRLDVKRAIELGVPKGPLLGQLKAGRSVSVGEGDTVRVVTPEEVLGPTIHGKRAAVLGDTNDSKGAFDILCGDSDRTLDLIVHEATLEDGLKQSAKRKGHSTPSQAAEVANSTKAKKLLLTHFSQRYDDEEIEVLAKEAKETFTGEILLARPLMRFPV